jgi:hypothetical protein
MLCSVLGKYSSTWPSGETLPRLTAPLAATPD